MVYPPKKKKKDSATTDWLKECRRKQAEEIEKANGELKEEYCRIMYEGCKRREQERIEAEVKKEKKDAPV